MTDSKLKSDVQIEDLPDGVWREFAKQHGIDPILGLAEIFGGAVVYIPSMSSIIRETRNRAVQEGTISPALKSIPVIQISMLIIFQ